jgi:hypothetical protein
MTDVAAPSCPTCGTAMVERRRRSDGARFWGCSNYPRCRGTRPFGNALERSEQPDQAGGSADRQFFGRRDRHKAAVASARGAILVRGASIVVIGLVVAIAEPSSWRLAGFAVAVVGVLSTIERLYVLPQHVRSWATGGDGERLTARLLEPLAAQGFVILHDRKIPRTVANIDHIAIGPTGVWVIETKNYTGRVAVRSGELRLNGRRRQGVRAQVEREVAAVATAAAPVEVRGIVVVHRAEFPWFGTLQVGQVPVVPPRELPRRIAKGPATLTASEITDLAGRIDRAFPRT